MYFHDDKPTAEDDALTGNDNANIGTTYDLTMTDEVFHMQLVYLFPTLVNVYGPRSEFG